MAPQSRRPTQQARAVGVVSRRLARVRASMLELERSVDLDLFRGRRESARNLLHYLALRRFDLRQDQTQLARWALSSLGRSEGHVLFTLDEVLAWLGGSGVEGLEAGTAGVAPEEARRILGENADALLGLPHRGRGARIMVTMPPEAASDYRIVRGLMDAGMDSARINCAHDTPEAWARMIAHIRRAERATRRRCWIQMDLGGPKIRTGSIAPGAQVLKLGPQRDAVGHVTAPASLWLVPAGGAPRVDVGSPVVPVGAAWLRRRCRGERVTFTDARGSRRTIQLVRRRDPAGWSAELGKTAYIIPGTEMVARREGGRKDSARIGWIPPLRQRIHLGIGDRLTVTARPVPGHEAQRSRDGRVVRPAEIACTLPQALASVRVGEPVWFDDGRIGATVRVAGAQRLLLDVTHAPPGGTSLGADKGINFPETDLDLRPLTAKDRQDLDFVVRNADSVGYSFVRRPGDIRALRSELVRRGRPDMGIVLKVETRRAFEELPELLLAALRYGPVGVMIARGDLAVEVGFERLAEVQEEMLWLCEAAHLPSIWATQVLEGLTKTGLPSRAEVTDAAMGERAECVMLNKGPHVVEAVRALDSILRRMQSHQSKKMAMLRHLKVVERFIREAEPSKG